MEAQARQRQIADGDAGEVTLLCVDLVDSTALIQALGDGRAGVVLARFADAARGLFRERGGREIDHTDGFLVLFDAPAAALATALDLHRRIAALGDENHARLGARAGIHRGAAITRANTPEAVALGAKPLELEGLAKAICARVCALAGAGQTLLTHAAFEDAQYARRGTFANAAELRWLGHGLYTLKGVDEPLLIHEVGQVGIAPLAPPSDVDKARHLRDDNLLTGWRAGAGQAIPGRDGWVLERKLGEGGFGDAWLAREHGSGAERVFKFCFQLGRLRSLQREVTLFRLLQGALGERADIARLLDWHLDAPPYCIESDYYPAGDFASWAAAGGGLDAIALDTRIALVAEVADALAAAHAVGVLHKDVKPGNVLIDLRGDGPHARLADFGIATLDAGSRYRHGRGIVLTGMTSVLALGESSRSVGTRMYMAPEQIEGREATTYADAYAVGVLLYQVVCGDFGQSLAPGWERDVADPLLREDIAGLIARDPAARIGSLEQLAARLRALPQRRAERAAAERREARELRRRRRLRWLVPAVAMLAAVVLALGWGIRRASIEAQRANREADTARAVTGLLVDVFRQADPEHTRGEDLTVREAMDRGAATIRDRFATQPEVQVPLLSAIGQVYLSLGLFDQAQPLLAQALQAGPDVLPRASPERAALRLSLQDTEDALGHYPRALELGEDALREARALHGDDSLDAARAHIALGNSYNGRHEAARAAQHLEAAIATLTRIAPRGDDHAEALWKLAVSYIYLGREDDAMKVLEQSLDILRSHPDASRTEVAAVYETMGGVERNRGNFRASLTHLRAAEQIYLDLGLGEHTSYASDLLSIANAQLLLGQYDGAARDFARSLAIYRKALGDKPYPSIALNLKALAATLSSLGRDAEALPLLRESKSQYERLPDLAALNVPRMQGLAGLAEIGVGHIAPGLAEVEASLATLAGAAAKAPDDQETIGTYADAALTAADALRRVGRAADARATCDEALARTQPLQRRATLIHNSVRRAKLLLCAGHATDAAPLLARLDASGYRDPFLDRLRGEAGTANMHATVD